MLRKLLRGVVLAAILVGTIFVITLAGRPASKDYISYWSAGHQLVHHHDPYSRSEVFALELSKGLDSAKPLIMRNPPWSLFLVYPLGLVSPGIGLLLWMAAAVASVALSLRVFEVPPRNRLIAFCFAPVYASLAVGQSSPFLLLGLTLFVMLYNSRPVLAGAALLFLAMKPHLFLTLWLVLLIDSFRRRNYRLLAGAAAAIGSASVVASCLNPHIWHDYLEMLRHAGIDGDFIPTPIGALSLWVSPINPILQWVCCGIGMLWAGMYYWRNRDSWDWSTHSLPLLLVGLLASPYEWMTDEIVLLPAMMAAISSPCRARHTFAVFMSFNAIAMVMLMEQVQLPSGAYVWTSTAWLALYLYSRLGSRSQAAEEPLDLLEPISSRAA